MAPGSTRLTAPAVAQVPTPAVAPPVTSPAPPHVPSPSAPFATPPGTASARAGRLPSRTPTATPRLPRPASGVDLGALIARCGSAADAPDVPTHDTPARPGGSRVTGAES